MPEKRDFPRKWDNLMLQGWRDCPTYFKWRHLYGLTRASGMSLPAAYGIALHSAIETLWKGGSLEEALYRVDTALQEHNHSYADSGVYTRQTAALILMKWVERFSESNRRLHFEKPEVGFLVPLSEDLDYYGRMDGVVEGGVYELKTTKSVYYILPNPHNQIEGYLWALSQFRENAEKATVDVLQLQLRNPDVFRFTTRRSKERLEEWRRETLFTISEIRRAYDSDIFPRNTSYCTSWGGCMFQDLCKLQGSRHLEAVMETYDISFWTPWEEEQEEPDSSVSLNETEKSKNERRKE